MTPRKTAAKAVAKTTEEPVETPATVESAPDAAPVDAGADAPPAPVVDPEVIAASDEVEKPTKRTKRNADKFDALAKEVLAGEWGANVFEQQRRLTAAGYNASDVLSVADSLQFPGDE